MLSCAEVNAAHMLSYARRHAGMTQRELASRAGVPQPAVARIERGRVAVGMDTLERLLVVTGMTLELTPRSGAGVDRSLIRASLGLTPEERILAAARAGTNLAAFVAEAARGSQR
jgi:transcriptional regulator with XRE-family HTH domain